MKVAVLTVKSTAGSMMRLAGVLLPAEREELASRLYQQALNVLGAVSLLDERIVVSTDSAVLDAARLAGARILKEPNQLSHSHSAERGVEMALRIAAHNRAVGADRCPFGDFRRIRKTPGDFVAPADALADHCSFMRWHGNECPGPISSRRDREWVWSRQLRETPERRDRSRG